MGGKDSGTTTTVQKSDPWSGIQPFLIGSSSRQLKPGVKPIYDSGNGSQYTTVGGIQRDQNGNVVPWGTENTSGGTGKLMNPESDYETTGTPGIYPEAQKLYQNSQWTPDMQKMASGMAQYYAGTVPDQVRQAQGIGNDLASGKYDANISPVSNISGVSPLSAAQVSAQQVDPTQAFGLLGGANPSGALQGLLSGQVNTSTLDPVVNNAMRRLTDNFNTQVMPGIGQSAVASGQYGSSRQGIAEGLAMKGLAQSMGDTTANLYNNAYQQAQQNMASTANNMAGLGLSNAQQNANRDLSGQQFNASAQNQMGQFNATNALDTQKFNANLGLQNNQQAMTNSQMNVSNRMQGINAGQTANSIANNGYNAWQGMQDAGNQYNWQQLKNYAGIIQPGAGIGGTSSSEQPYFSNPVGSAVGTASQLAGIAKMIGWL